MRSLGILLSTVLWCRAAQVRKLPDPFAGKLQPTLSGQLELELMELLNEDDLSLSRQRLLSLKGMFPKIIENDMNVILDRSPILLTIESETLKIAIDTMKVQLPLCDPSYIIQQRVAGVELIMAFVSNNVDVSSQIIEVSNILGYHMKSNITVLNEFIRRCPFVILPKYARILNEHLQYLQSELHLKRPACITTIEKFPSLLEINLPNKFHQLNSTLWKVGIEVDRACLAKIIKSVPRVLVQDISRRIDNLKSLYPSWEINKIVKEYPRILTQKYSVLDSHYQALVNEFEGKVDVDALVNAFPSVLCHSVTNIRDKLEILCFHLPSCTPKSLLHTAPEMLSYNIDHTIVPRIKKTRALFAPTKVSVTISVPVMTEVFVPTSDVPSPIQKADQGVKYSTLELARQLAKSWDDEDKASLLAEYDFSDRHDRDLYEIEFPMYATDMREEREEINPLLTPVQTDNPLSGEDLTLDVSRIVMGNTDGFLNRYSLFARYIRDWIKEYDEVAAYVILSAAPRYLEKKPDRYLDTIKELYSYVAKHTLPLTPSTSSTYINVSGLKGCSNGLTISPTYEGLYSLLMDAPTALKYSPTELRGHITFLNDHVAYGDSPEKIIFKCPRLLVESKDKVSFIVELLPQLIQSCAKGSLDEEMLTQHVNGLVHAQPRVLVMPLSLLARIRYTRTRLTPVDELLKNLPALLDCNTAEYLRRMGAFGRVGNRASSYGEYLQGAIIAARGCVAPERVGDVENETAAAEGFSERMELDATALEKTLCGLLNNAAKSSDQAMRTAVMHVLCAQ